MSAHYREAGPGHLLDIHRFLTSGDGGGRLDGNPDDYRHTGADAAEHPTSVVGPGNDFSILDVIKVVIFGTFHARDGKAGTELHSLDRRNGEQGFSQLTIKIIEDRLAQSRRYIKGNALDSPAQAVFLSLRLFYQLRHLLGGFMVGTPQRVFSGSFFNFGQCLRGSFDTANVNGMGKDIDAQATD